MLYVASFSGLPLALSTLYPKIKLEEGLVTYPVTNVVKFTASGCS